MRSEGYFFTKILNQELEVRLEVRKLAHSSDD